jgi:hypothetical protein
MGIPIEEENAFLLIWDNYYVYYTFTESIIEIQSVHHQKENVIR